jgi:type II secretory pathway pseudopilin PulG
MIATKKIVKQNLQNPSQKQNTAEGFSLIEATVALTTLGICLAYAMPLFLYSKLNNIKSEVRTGALMASQQIFDEIRGMPFQNIPCNNVSTTSPIRDDNDNKCLKVATVAASPTQTVIDANGIVMTAAGKTASSIPKDRYTVMGRNYTAKVFYCETPIGQTNECNASYKKFRVAISIQGKESEPSIYEMEAGFTNFQ